MYAGSSQNVKSLISQINTKCSIYVDTIGINMYHF